MKISFFEELTTEENLAKIQLIPKEFQSRIYIAAHNLKEFQNFCEKLPIPLAYWLVLRKSDGYWISPFSKRRALLEKLNEVRFSEIEFMLDLENPVHTPSLYFTEMYNFYRNKKFLKEFINKSLSKNTLVELPGKEKRLKFWGLTYNSDNASYVKMVYTSLLPMCRRNKILKLKSVCKTGVDKYGSRFKIGLGCIATGIGGKEKLLTAQELAEDLHIAKELNVKETIIFRLGGLTDEYIKNLHI